MTPNLHAVSSAGSIKGKKRFAVGLEAFVERSYQPFVRRLLKHRYLTLITSVGFPHHHHWRDRGRSY